MLESKIKIGSESAFSDMATRFGLVYVSSDNKLGVDKKGFETTNYPEEEGEHIIPKSVDAPFDYTVKFYVKAEGSNETANAKIAAFNSELYTPSNGVKTFKKVQFYNVYKRTLIVGYPSLISEAKDFWRDSKGNTHDVVLVEWKIRVTKPSDCNFNYTGS